MIIIVPLLSGVAQISPWANWSTIYPELRPWRSVSVDQKASQCKVIAVCCSNTPNEKIGKAVRLSRQFLSIIWYTLGLAKTRNERHMSNFRQSRQQHKELSNQTLISFRIRELAFILDNTRNVSESSVEELDWEFSRYPILATVCVTQPWHITNSLGRAN